MTEEHFISADQRLMTAATNYRRWLFGLIAPSLAGDILEIGAGIGNLTALARAVPAIRSYHAVEADPVCSAHLRQLLADTPFPWEVLTGYFPATMPTGKKYDFIFHFNVLEHIADDVGALRACRELLKDEGRMFLFVPACPSLYGSMDRVLEHHRRYRRRELAEKLRSVGLTPEYLRHCNMAGFMGWFINNRILGITSQKSSQIRIFDRLVLPIQNRIEAICPPPFGQNLYGMATAATVRPGTHCRD
jgi:SAM-dependent methyltransferase